jgi:hypothetical protein
MYLRVLPMTLLCLVLVSLGSVFGQTVTTGDLTGTVKDATDAIVIGATVSLKNWDTGELRTVTTNASGAYRFTFLQSGNYQVSASSSGLKSDFSRVRINVGEVATVDLVAKIQSTQSVIEVTTAVAAVDTDNANLTSTYETKAVMDLPMPGGDITTIAFTVPGIAISTGGGYGNFSSHGMSATSNLFTMNGNDYNDPYFNINNSGATNLLLGQNEVAEAAVVQNAYSVQYGRNAGAQVNYVTKSGTNDFHGSVLYNWNGDALNANDFFANASGTQRPRAISNQYGGLVSGPIVRSKLFFLFDTEGLRYVLPFSGVATIPTQTFENYMLANLPASAQPIYQQAIKVWNNAPGVSRATLISNGNGLFQDSQGNLGCGSLTGTPVAAGGGAGTFGVDTPCGESWGTSASNKNTERLLTARVDWNIKDKQKIFFRFKADRGLQATGTNLLTPAFNTDSNQPQDEGQIDYTYIFTPTLVNHFIGSVLWYSADFGPDSTSAAMAALPTYFQIGGGPNAAGDGGGGSNGSGGFTSVGVNWSGYPQGRNVDQRQLIDDVSWTKGVHTLKFGVNMRHSAITDISDTSGTTGSYFFSDVSDFAQGVTGGPNFSYYYQRFSPLLATHFRFLNIGTYAQDEWNITRNVKLTYGLRLESTSNPSCVDKCFSNLTAPFTSSDFKMGADIPYNASIVTGMSNAYYKVNPYSLNPRVGLVWSPAKNNNTVVRGGFGMFADMPAGFFATSVSTNPPFPYSAVVGDGSVVGPASSPGTAAAGALNQYNAFKTGFAGGETLAQLNASVPGGFSPLNFFSTPATFETPQVLEWSFEIQQMVGRRNVFVATYSGNKGYNEIVPNQFVNAYAANGSGFGGLPATQPDPRFNNVTQLLCNGVSNYNGVTVQYKRILGYGFSGQLNYTWGHALDTISNGGILPYSFSGNNQIAANSPTIANNYSNADYDIRHNFVGDFEWEIPYKFQNKIANNVIGGWTIAGKLYIRTGTPFSVIDSSLVGSVGAGSMNATGVLVPSNILATITDPSINTNCGVSAVNTPCFAASQLAAAGTETTWGNYPRNSFRGPGYTSIDTSLYKSFHFTERAKLTVGASAYNLFNHPNFAPPNADVAGSGLGTIVSTAIPPTSAYGAFQGSAVSGRVLVLNGRFTF